MKDQLDCEMAQAVLLVVTGDRRPPGGKLDPSRPIHRKIAAKQGTEVEQAVHSRSSRDAAAGGRGPALDATEAGPRNPRAAQSTGGTVAKLAQYGIPLSQRRMGGQ